MTGNPWHYLPAEPPYVLPEEAADVRAFNDRVGADDVRFLQVEKLIPEPFVGVKEAPVILLSNNPGCGKGADARQHPDFKARMRRNLHHEPLDYPFVYLGPASGGPGRQWWEKKLKHVLKEFAREVVARSLLNVAYFPYPSKRYGHGRLRLGSQEYGFYLVREAMKRGAVIVSMRTKDRWVSAVPELGDYDRLFQVCNVQNPTVSPRNCPGYREVVGAIARTGRG